MAKAKVAGDVECSLLNKEYIRELTERCVCQRDELTEAGKDTLRYELSKNMKSPGLKATLIQYDNSYEIACEKSKDGCIVIFQKMEDVML